MKASRFLLGIALFASALTLHAANLVTNGGFNTDLSQWSGGGEMTLPTQWERADASGTPNSGSARLTWAGPTVPGPTAAGLVQSFRILQGGSYAFSARGRVTNQPAANALVLVIWKQADGGTVTVGLPLQVNNTSFTTAQMSVQAPMNATSAVIVLTIPRQNGISILFDDIGLQGQAGVAPPAVTAFTSNPPSIRPGEKSRLLFDVANATGVSIDNGIGTVGVRGAIDVSPSATTTYTLTATGPGGTVTAKTMVNVLSAPTIVPSKFPIPMLEFPGSAPATTSYIISNIGGASAHIDLQQDGDFFTQTPTSFDLAAGASQKISISGKPLPAGEYRGASIVGSNGHKLFDVRVPMLSIPPPNGSAMALPIKNRVDVISKSGTNPTGVVTFQNPSAFPVAGVVSSDVKWITFEKEIIVVPPGSSVDVSFSIDRSQRDDGSDPSGSATGTISLKYFNGLSSGSKGTGLLDSSGTSLVGVVVVDTVTPTSSASSVPALSTDEIGLLVPGVGHVTGSGGKEFISDVSIANPSTSSLDDMKLYYTSTTTSASNSQALTGSQSLALADVVTSYFGQTAQIGTLHVRSTSATKLSVNANVFNKSNSDGTYGTALPTLRTDRAISAGQTLILSGLRKDSAAHTNIYLQEMAGGSATADITFIDTTGATVSTITGKSLTSWGLQSINDAAPTGAVAAIVSDTSGKISAFATPVDDASGDTWAIADWDRQSALTGSEAMLVPVVGAAAGANNTNFKSDVTVTNFGTSASTVSLYYTGNGATKTLSLNAGETKVFNNIVPGFFEVSGDSVGALFATPADGSNILVTSRTYTASTDSAATYGTGVPTMPISGSLSSGGSRVFGGIEDSTTTTVSAKQGGTFRSNFGLVETSGKSVTVQVSVSFADGTQLTAGGANASFPYTLAAKEYKQLNGVVQSVMGPARSNYGDLRNVSVTFSVVSGDGSVIPFITSTDNGTGDTVLRTE